MHNNIIFLDFHGTVIKILSNDEECLSFIKTDFSYFLVCDNVIRQQPEVVISILYSDPPYELIPKGIIAAYHTKDAVVYIDGDISYFDSFGKCLVIYNHRSKSVEIYTIDRDTLHEKSYLMIMSRVGELLDRKKLHRIHAMGVVYNGKAVLCLLPMGGGKTTLALSLLENSSFSLLSEEVPLVSNKGILYSFPIRMGVIAGTTLSIPKEFLKNFNRSNYPPKTLIDVRYFKDQISISAEPGFLFIGKRIYSESPKIIKVSKFKAFHSLFSACVMGVGIPQLMEYILRFDPLDMVRQFPIFCSRIWAVLLLLKRSKVFELYLGYNQVSNSVLLSDFISKNCV